MYFAARWSKAGIVPSRKISRRLRRYPVESSSTVLPSHVSEYTGAR